MIFNGKRLTYFLYLHRCLDLCSPNKLNQMKTILYFFLFFFSIQIFAQSPQLINYQGIVRDPSGNPLTNQNVALQFVILQGPSPGTSVFTEIQSVSTGSLGLFSTQIGINQNLSTVNFYSGTYSIQVNLDVAGGSNFVAMGSPQILASVPYALHANTVPATFINNVLTIGLNNSFTLSSSYTPSLSLSGTDNNILSDGTNTVALNTYTVGTGLLMSGAPNYTISSTASNPTLIGIGMAQVTPSTGTTFTVDVPSSTLTALSNTLSLSQGSVVSTVTLPVQPQGSLTVSGIASVSSIGTNSFNIQVPAPQISISQTAGVAAVSSLSPANFTINIPPLITPSITGTGIAAVSPTTGNNFTVTVNPPSFATVGPSSITGVYPNFTINSPQTPTVSAAGIATVSAGPNYLVGVQSPSYTSAGPSSITGVYPNFTLNSPVTPTVTATGIATVSAGPNYLVGVQSPSYTSAGPSSITGVYPNFTINSPQTPTVSAAGIATVSAGPNYLVGVQSPSYTSSGPSSITGVYPNFTLNSPVTPTVTAAGIATVSAGPNYIVGVPQTTFAYNNVTGSLTSGTSSVYITPNLSYSLGILSSGPASNSIAINSGTNALWSTLGNVATNATVNFIGTSDNVHLNFRINNLNSGTINHVTFNTALGYQSLNAVTTGTSNTSMGASSLSFLTSGNRNVALGYNAMQTTTSGSDNVALGFSALRVNNSVNNIAIGSSALSANASGNSNVAIGLSALGVNVGGNYNTAIGHVAGGSTNGGLNVFVGYASGAQNNGSGNVFIGYQSGFYITGSNKFVLANTTTSVSPLLYGDFTSGNVSIGTTSANAPLQFANTTVNRKIVLWEGANNDHQFYGLGVNAGTLRFQVNSTADAHVFFAGTGVATSNELFRINGTGHVRMGNETGTAQGPIYPVGNNGLIIRRIFNNVLTAGSIVARTDNIQFERDGSNGGFRVNVIAGSNLQVCNCVGVNNIGLPLNKAFNNLALGVTQIYTNAENAVYFHCILGDPYGAGHITEVTLTRQATDYYWVGTITTTFNQ